MPAFHRGVDLRAAALSLDHVAAVIEPTFWILLGILFAFSWVALVGGGVREFLRARNFE